MWLRLMDTLVLQASICVKHASACTLGAGAVIRKESKGAKG